jgi:DNA/RNA endonuclease G (NUC1)
VDGKVRGILLIAFVRAELARAYEYRFSIMKGLLIPTDITHFETYIQFMLSLLSIDIPIYYFKVYLFSKRLRGQFEVITGIPISDISDRQGDYKRVCLR